MGIDMLHGSSGQKLKLQLGKAPTLVAPMPFFSCCQMLIRTKLAQYKGMSWKQGLLSCLHSMTSRWQAQECMHLFSTQMHP